MNVSIALLNIVNRYQYCTPVLYTFHMSMKNSLTQCRIQPRPVASQIPSKIYGAGLLQSVARNNIYNHISPCHKAQLVSYSEECLQRCIIYCCQYTLAALFRYQCKLIKACATDQSVAVPGGTWMPRLRARFTPLMKKKCAATASFLVCCRYLNYSTGGVIIVSELIQVTRGIYVTFSCVCILYAFNTCVIITLIFCLCHVEIIVWVPLGPLSSFLSFLFDMNRHIGLVQAYSTSSVVLQPPLKWFFHSAKAILCQVSF